MVKNKKFFRTRKEKDQRKKKGLGHKNLGGGEGKKEAQRKPARKKR